MRPFHAKNTWRELWELYRLTSPASNLEPRYNVCPTTVIDTVAMRRGERTLCPCAWPRAGGWKKPLNALKAATFNARAETVAEKPFFREAFRRGRCLIPVSGYYEWQDTAGGKQPHYFTARDRSPVLTIAGLWDEWIDVERRKPLQSSCMIITDANDFVAQVHDRMPVLPQPEHFDAWLSGKATRALLQPPANDLLQRWPVSRRVNSSRAADDDASLIELAAA